MRRAAVVVALLVLTGCGSSSITSSDATQFWRQQVAHHYNGVVAHGDGRGCVKQAAHKWSCTAYVRNAQNSLSSGMSVIGTVTVSGGVLGVHARPARGTEIQDWFSRTGGCKTDSC